MRKEVEEANVIYYADTGCDVSSACLQCPLELCKHDDPVYYLQWKADLRGETPRKKTIMEVKLRITEGMSFKEISQEYGIPTRTIRRYKTQL